MAGPKLPSVTSVSNVEWGDGGDRIRLVSCQLKPKAHFNKRLHLAFITCECHSAAFHIRSSRTLSPLRNRVGVARRSFPFGWSGDERCTTAQPKSATAK